MSVRWRINILWLVMISMAFLSWEMLAQQAKEKAAGASSGVDLLQIALCIVLFGMAYFIDSNPALIVRRLFPIESGFDDKNNFLPILMSRNDTAGVKALMFYSAMIYGPVAVAPAISLMVTNSQGPFALSLIFCIASVLSLLYFRWRSHVVWEPLFLGKDGKGTDISHLRQPLTEEAKAMAERKRRLGMKYLMPWVNFFVFAVILHVNISIRQFPKSQEAGWQAVIYTLLVLSVIQTIILVAYDFLSVSRPSGLKVSIPAGASREIIEGIVETAKVSRLRRAVLTCCIISALSGIYAVAATYLVGLSAYTHIFMGFFWVGLLYTGRRANVWYKLYFE